VSAIAKVLHGYHGVPAPENDSPALLLGVDDVVDVLSTEDDFWWEVSVSSHNSLTRISFSNKTFTVAGAHA